ncbi:nucleotide exchange factor GrpE [Salicibibacter kimchii]|uniref:Protein GrpE n=1 Tax=Salicibibacter kimchii TaxID=2099786 RepID=A0A345BUP5_9BACI|nr:nucleotide exchange factor GrpE [Salicibibacter kimchii]AXF54676.1 nucleotide exchange factor GrpE [Salicibibacter kimchii]
MNEKEESDLQEEEVEIIDPDTEDTPSDSADEDVEASESQEEIEALQAELEAWQNKAQRVQADYDNFRKRSRSEKEAAAQFRSQPLMEALLPVLDNFSRAFDTEGQNSSNEGLYKGMEMVYRQFWESLESEGLEEIPTEGETFDPNVHQAVMQVEEEGFEPNQIVEELQKGYKLKTRVIRPAMVKVNA